MSVRFAEGPRDGAALVQAGLARQALSAGPLMTRLANVRADVRDLALNEPHAVYDLHADELAAGKGLVAAHASGFRYLVHAAGEPVAAAEVHPGAPGGASLLANTNFGQFVETSSRAFDEAAKLEPVQHGVYEARLLRCSAVFLMAVWLKSENATQPDIIVPMAPAPSGLEADRPYDEPALLAAIAPLARMRTANSPSQPVP
jgi:hypothetical protein